MKICAAQTKPTQGDIPANIDGHQRLIEMAAAHGAGIIIFPELSLTGYEPRWAKEWAIDPDDARLREFQELSEAKGIIIGVGAPTRSAAGICISMVIFEPQQARRVYAKSYLHADEVPFFVPGRSSPHWEVNGTNLALAICYEISVAEHWETARKNRPAVYVASVAKFSRGIGQALERLSEMARENSMMVLMANSVGPADGNECAGRTSIWSRTGELLGQLDGAGEGILVVDTETQEIEKALIQTTS
jgi:predicted amidohydrolase